MNLFFPPSDWLLGQTLLERIFTWSFLISLLVSGIRLAVPVLLAVLGEVITQRSGVLNLGLEGILLMGSLAGFATTYHLEQAGVMGAAWTGLAAGILAGMAMGSVMAILAVRLKADQVVAGVTLVLLGQGLSTYLFRQLLPNSNVRVTGLSLWPIPGLSGIPGVGMVLFNHDPMVYLSGLLVPTCWFLLFRTRFGRSLRAVGENPAAAETSGISVERTRWIAILIGSALAGLGGAVLTVVQLRLFAEGITAGRGWIAVALVFFARWHPWQALLGSLLFGVADALQFRIQALGSQQFPYEFLLMLPYLLTLAVLWRKGKQVEAPAALGIPYLRGQR
ncbi:ABC transporter permease [Synechococcus sp. Nb3U1]|uniref:ABC transporter permease n=1 Tax=Synechococcus sp. Nb3U1 TaxID=1914529 RepID=UPI001F2FFECB|nr:ABC transporter permease [Synechococcus sp. Nb3U1]MCF2972544.1 ABC transporter permease [Synechococcus sp. Nb3U1]